MIKIYGNIKTRHLSVANCVVKYFQHWYNLYENSIGEVNMKKLNKLIAGIALAATLIAGNFGYNSNEAAASIQEEPMQNYSITSDPGGGGGH